MRESVEKREAARLASKGGFGQLGGEVCVPLLYSNRYRAEKQERIFERLAGDRRRAQVLAVHHMSLAERFLQEAEALGDLLRESEALTS